MNDEPSHLVSCSWLETEGEMNGFVNSDRCSLGYKSAF